MELKGVFALKESKEKFVRRHGGEEEKENEGKHVGGGVRSRQW
jgi:hypothetical protein